MSNATPSPSASSAMMARRLKHEPTPALGTCPASASRTGMSLPCSSANSSM